MEAVVNLPAGEKGPADPAPDSAQFLDEPIEVDYDTAGLALRALTWRGQGHQVAETLRTWQDFHTPEYAGHARGWRHRRHRNYFIVRTAGGEVLEVYLDRAGGRRTWVLLKRYVLALHRLVVGEWGANCFLLESDGQCLVVDPGREAERILAAVAEWTVVGILLTHGHPDHLGAAEAVRLATGAPLYVHPADAAAFAVTADGMLTDGQSLQAGWFGVVVAHVPGHTPGSVCLRFDDRALVGDALFPGGPGRTGSPEDLTLLLTSLDRVVFSWPDETRLYPGHGEGATIGAVRGAFLGFTRRPRRPDLCGDVVWTPLDQ